MTTVINTPSNNESTGAGFAVGVVVVIVILLGILFVYGVPALRGGTTPSANINVNLPTGGATGGSGTTGSSGGQ